MALLWAETFDLFGNNTGLLAQNGYADCNVDYVYFNNGQSRTGPGCAVLDLYGQVLRRALTNPVNVAGQGCGIKPLYAGTMSPNGIGFRFENAAKAPMASIVVLGNLSIGVFDNTGTMKGVSAPNVMVNATYSWVETKVTANNGANANTGSVEVRVAGQPVVIVNGINIPGPFLFVSIGRVANDGFAGILDDYIIWDTTGPYNNDFMGDRRLVVSYPNANGALQDFVPVGAANAYDCLNDSPPTGTPNDTVYIEGAAAGNISEFAKGAIGIASTDVAAVMVFGRIAKSDGGAAAASLGINSAGVILNSPDINPDVAYKWFRNIVERDPNGAIPWTRAAVDAATIRITRTA